MTNISEVFGYWVTYLGIEAIVAQARILGGVRTLYSWSEEQLIHPFGRHAEEVLNGSRAFWIEFPHPERPTFAWQDPPN